MLTNDNKRLYYNSMSALAYLENGHEIPLSNFAHHFIMVFDLTSTQEATLDFIRELTNSPLSVELKFDTDLPNNNKLEKNRLLFTLALQEKYPEVFYS